MSYIYRYSKTSPQISSIDYPSIAFLTSNPIVERVKGISGRQGSSSGYAGAYASLTAVFRVSLSAYTRIRTLLVCIALVEASLLFSPLHAKSPLSGAQRGAGVQNRFCGPQCFQLSQSLCRAFSPAFLVVPTKSMIQAPSIPFIGGKRNEPSKFYPKAHAMERVNRIVFVDASVPNALRASILLFSIFFCRTHSFSSATTSTNH